MAYSNIVAAIAKTVLEARVKVLEDIKTFVIEKVDEDSADTFKELFDDFRKEFDKTVEEESKGLLKGGRKGKGAKKGGGAAGGEKRTRKPTPYNMFVSENMKRFKQENPALNGKETMKMAMEAWSALSDDEKKAYREKMLSSSGSEEEKEEKESEKEDETEPEEEKEPEPEPEPEPEEKKKPAAKKGGKKGAK